MEVPFALTHAVRVRHVLGTGQDGASGIEARVQQWVRDYEHALDLLGMPLERKHFWAGRAARTGRRQDPHGPQVNLRQLSLICHTITK